MPTGADASLVPAAVLTLSRASVGFALAVVVGATVGLAVAAAPVVRVVLRPVLTGLQAMPSIAWFPLALLLFDRSDRAIVTVVVLGAAPAVAIGLLHGVDHTPPLLHRAGQVLGATGLDRYRLLVVPAALPGFVGGLKQGWAFAWRSLMAGELLLAVDGPASLGARLQAARDVADLEGLLTTLAVILLIGVVVDVLVLGRLDAAVRRRRGLVPQA